MTGERDYRDVAMSRAPMDRGKARTYSHVAQAGLVVAAGAALTVAALGLPFLRAPGDPKSLTLPTVDLPQAPKTADDPAKAPVDFSAVAQRLVLVSNSPRLPDATPTDTPAPTDSPPTTPQGNQTRFLGVATIGTVRVALVHDGTRQRFVRLGDHIGDDTVIAITDTKITLRGPTGERDLDLAPRTGPIVTKVAARVPGGQMPPGVGPNAMGARGQGVPGANPAGVRPTISPVTRNFQNTPAGVPGAAGQAGAGPQGMSQEQLGSILSDKAKAAGVLNNPQARYDEIVAQLKASGRFKSTEEAQVAAKEIYEAELTAAQQGATAPTDKKVAPK